MTSYVRFEIVTQLDCLSKVEEEVNADVCMIFTYYFVVVGKKSSNKLRMKALVGWNTFYQHPKLINFDSFLNQNKD